MVVKLFILTPGMPKKVCPPEKKRNLAMLKRKVSISTYNAILLNGSVPAKTNIFQLRFSLDY